MGQADGHELFEITEHDAGHDFVDFGGFRFGEAEALEDVLAEGAGDGGGADYARARGRDPIQC